jgi:hypothetical protein
VIVVGNRGNTPISPGLKITLNAGGKPQEPAFLPEAIEPGGLSVPFEFGRDFLANELTATIEYETDCDATNNSRSVILGSLGCR